VEAARLDLELSAPWRASQLTGQAGLASSAAIGAAAATTDISFSVRATAPVITGLSLSAQVSKDALSAGATVRPLARADPRAEETLAKAEIQVAETERLAAVQARATYRAAWLGILDLVIRQKSLEAAEAKAEAVSLNAAAGVGTQSDVISADSARIDAMVAVLDSKDRADTALADLSRLVGRAVAATELVEPDPGADREPLAKEAWLAAKATLATLGIELTAAKRAALPVLPDLALSGSLTQGLPATTTPTWSVSASVTLDPDTFLRGKDRASSLDLERSARKATESRQDASEEYDSLAARIASARSALEGALRIGTTASLAYEKSSYLAEAGTVSGASLLDSEVSLLSARYRVAKARSDLGAALDALDAKLGALDAKLGALDAKLGALDAKLGALDAKLGAQDRGLGRPTDTGTVPLQ
jgi:outer membrane protein TolC